VELGQRSRSGVPAGNPGFNGRGEMLAAVYDDVMAGAVLSHARADGQFTEAEAHPSK
jgi:hypothetical protein